MLPADVGVKLMGRVQGVPSASDPAELAELDINGQADDPTLFNVKLAAMLGLFPLDGIGKVSAALPRFHTVTVCGLSLLVEPTSVNTKLRAGGFDTFNSNTLLSISLAT
jgi:hypothetical protein